MKRIALLGVLAAVLGGCGDGSVMQRDADQIVGECITAMGGLERWEAVEAFRTRAVVSLYGEDGAERVNRHAQVIRLDPPHLAAEAKRPRGSWAAVVSLGEPDVVFDVVGEVSLGEKEQAELLDALKVILHRVRGPLNLVEGPERPAERSEARIDGDRMTRITVEGDYTHAVAYYFDKRTCRLRYVTSGADAAGREGTVTRYTWATLPNGMLFPRTLEVFRIGDHVLLGDTPVMRAEFYDVTVE